MRMVVHYNGSLIMSETKFQQNVIPETNCMSSTFFDLITLANEMIMGPLQQSCPALAIRKERIAALADGANRIIYWSVVASQTIPLHTVRPIIALLSSDM